MKMKFLAAAPLLAACALTAPLAMAATDAEFKLDGVIAVGSCDVTTPSSGEYAYGDIPNDSLSAAGTALAVKVNTFSITCPAPMKVAFRLTDNRDGTLYPGTIPGAPGAGLLLGLNLDPSGKPIGYYGIKMIETKVEGVAGSKMLYSSNNGLTWDPLTASAWASIDATFAPAPAGVPAPVALTTASFNIQAFPFLAPRSDLDLSRGLELDGATTLELFYM